MVASIGKIASLAQGVGYFEKDGWARGGGRYGEKERALDARLAGKSDCEISAPPWGAEAVADWHPDDALRSRVASATAFMKGADPKLLPGE